MAKALQFFYEYKDYAETLHRVEIWVEGFVGSAEELQGGAEPFTVNTNKTVGSKYLGGIVSTRFNLQAFSTTNFKSASFTSQNFGDVTFIKKVGSTVEYEGIIEPFESSDQDLPDFISRIELSAVCGLNYLKNVDYVVTDSFVQLKNLLGDCLEQIPLSNSFDVAIIDNTLAYKELLGTGILWWETYINDNQFKDKSYFEVLEELLRGSLELAFDKSRWLVRNIYELSTSNSTIHTYNAAMVLQSSVAYSRTPTTIDDRLGGSFSRQFSFKNIEITKPKSLALNQFLEGEFDNLNDWTANGTAALIFSIDNGRLYNQGNTVKDLASDANYYQNTNGVSFYPYKGAFDFTENDVPTIRIKSENGINIKNLRVQIIAQQMTGTNSNVYFLTNEGTWYREETGVGTPIYLIEDNDKEVKIEVPTPPYIDGVAVGGELTEFGYFQGANTLFPPSNIEYQLYVRIYLPERFEDAISGSERDSYIDYVRIELNQKNDETFEGFTKDYGVDTYVDIVNRLNTSVVIGHNTFPQGLDTLYYDSAGTEPIIAYRHNGILPNKQIDEIVADEYLQVLAQRLRRYNGKLNAELSFGDIVEIDSIKYRIQNLRSDKRSNFSDVEIVELSSAAFTISSETVDRLDVPNLESNRTKLEVLFQDINFQGGIDVGGRPKINLRPDPIFEEAKMTKGEMFLVKENNTDTALNWGNIDNTVTDYIKPISGGFEIKAEGVDAATIATDVTAWMLGGNTIGEKKLLGSVDDYDVGIIRNNTEIATIKSTGVDVVGKITATSAAVTGLTTNYLPKVGSGGLLGNSQIFDNGTYVALSSTGASITFARSTGANIGGVGWSSGVFYLGGHPDYLPVAGNDVKLYGFTGNLSLGNAAAGDVLNVTQSGNVLIGTSTDSGNKLEVNGTTRTTNLKITNGAAVGYLLQATNVDGSSTWVDPANLIQYKGTWSPATNTPTLVDGTGTVGDYYRIIGTASRDLGSGSIEWTDGYDIRYNGSIWEELPVGSLVVASSLALGSVKVGTTLEIAGDGTLNQKTGVATAGTYQSVTVDTYGRVTAGTNPTTLAGYGITDAYTQTEINNSLALKYNSADFNTDWDTRYGTEHSQLNDKTIPYWDGDEFLNSPITVDKGAVSVGTITASILKGIGYNIQTGTFTQDGSIYQVPTLSIDNSFAISSVNQSVFSIKPDTNSVVAIGINGTLGATNQVLIADRVNGDRWASFHTGYITDWSTAWDAKYNAITKNTAYNKNFGTSAGEVSEGNHTHLATDITDFEIAWGNLWNTNKPYTLSGDPNQSGATATWDGYNLIAKGYPMFPGEAELGLHGSSMGLKLGGLFNIIYGTSANATLDLGAANNEYGTIRLRASESVELYSPIFEAIEINDGTFSKELLGLRLDEFNAAIIGTNTSTLDFEILTKGFDGGGGSVDHVNFISASDGRLYNLQNNVAKKYLLEGEGGSGGTIGNIDQVLGVGDTATNKSIRLKTSGSAGVFFNQINDASIGYLRSQKIDLGGGANDDELQLVANENLRISQESETGAFDIFSKNGILIKPNYSWTSSNGQDIGVVNIQGNLKIDGDQGQGLPNYSSNAAAILGGLQIGTLYRNGEDVKVVI